MVDESIVEICHIPKIHVLNAAILHVGVQKFVMIDQLTVAVTMVICPFFMILTLSIYESTWDLCPCLLLSYQTQFIDSVNLMSWPL